MKKNPVREARPKRGTILSLRFYRSKHGWLSLDVQSNPESADQQREFRLCDLHFATELLQSSAISFGDLAMLVSLFAEVKKKIRTKLAASD